jgi:hypothetical protein
MNKEFSRIMVLLLVASSFSVYSQETPGKIPSQNNSVDSSKQNSVVDTSTQNSIPKSVVNTVTVSSGNSDTNKIDSVQQNDTTANVPSSASTTTVLLINSVPPGAAVLLNDSVLGVTPAIMNQVTPGNYGLVLKMKGYYQKKAQITVVPGDTQKINLELLKPAMITYLSSPEKVTISANGKNRGNTPFTDSLVKPGDYLIQGSLQGYELAIKNITVANGATDTVMLEMKKTGEEQKGSSEETKGSEKEVRPIKKYSGIIGAIAFAVFAVVLLIAEHDNL